VDLSSIDVFKDKEKREKIENHLVSESFGATN
jgi:hypothetical protein